jgi:hypothetical protein
MPLYYFHFRNGVDADDEEGTSFDSVVDAMQHANRVAQEIGKNRSAGEIAGEQILVTDESGLEVFRAPVTNGR